MRNKPTRKSSTEAELAARIEALEIEATDLRERLEQIQEAQENADTVESFEGFEIGDQVRVKNKGKYNFTEGQVHKITKNFISFTSATGQKTHRARKNLIVIARGGRKIKEPTTSSHRA